MQAPQTPPQKSPPHLPKSPKYRKRQHSDDDEPELKPNLAYLPSPNSSPLAHKSSKKSKAKLEPYSDIEDKKPKINHELEEKPKAEALAVGRPKRAAKVAGCYPGEDDWEEGGDGEADEDGYGDIDEDGEYGEEPLVDIVGVQPRKIAPSNHQGMEVIWDRQVKVVNTTKAKSLYKLDDSYLYALDRETTRSSMGYKMYLYSEHQVQKAAYDKAGGEVYFKARFDVKRFGGPSDPSLEDQAPRKARRLVTGAVKVGRKRLRFCHFTSTVGWECDLAISKNTKITAVARAESGFSPPQDERAMPSGASTTTSNFSAAGSPASASTGSPGLPPPPKQQRGRKGKSGGRKPDQEEGDAPEPPRAPHAQVPVATTVSLMYDRAQNEVLLKVFEVTRLGHLCNNLILREAHGIKSSEVDNLIESLRSVRCDTAGVVAMNQAAEQVAGRRVDGGEAVHLPFEIGGDRSGLQKAKAVVAAAEVQKDGVPLVPVGLGVRFGGAGPGGMPPGFVTSAATSGPSGTDAFMNDLSGLSPDEFNYFMRSLDEPGGAITSAIVSPYVHSQQQAWTSQQAPAPAGNLPSSSHAQQLFDLPPAQPQQYYPPGTQWTHGALANSQTAISVPGSSFDMNGNPIGGFPSV
ncbi:hypothetical protein P7C70_g4433, partial [Phenoliferia sp. Uapishka_3]